MESGRGTQGVVLCKKSEEWEFEIIQKSVFLGGQGRMSLFSILWAALICINDSIKCIFLMLFIQQLSLESLLTFRFCLGSI